MQVESQIDRDLTLVEHLDLDNLDLVRRTLVLSVAFNRSLLESELGSIVREATDYARTILNRSQPYEAGCDHQQSKGWM